MHWSLPLFLLLTPLLFVACRGDTAARHAARGEFYVSDPDHLYFKNTRSRHYAAQELAQGLTLYTHDELKESGSRLELYIADNWINDFARLTVVLRPDGAQANTSPEDLRLEVADGQDGWLPLAFETPAEIRELRDRVASARDLRIVHFGEVTPAFPRDAARSAALEVLNDYLRLIDYQ